MESVESLIYNIIYKIILTIKKKYFYDVVRVLWRIKSKNALVIYFLIVYNKKEWRKIYD